MSSNIYRCACSSAESHVLSYRDAFLRRACQRSAVRRPRPGAEPRLHMQDLAGRSACVTRLCNISDASGITVHGVTTVHGVRSLRSDQVRHERFQILTMVSSTLRRHELVSQSPGQRSRKGRETTRVFSSVGSRRWRCLENESPPSAGRFDPMGRAERWRWTHRRTPSVVTLGCTRRHTVRRPCFQACPRFRTTVCSEFESARARWCA